MFQHVSKYSKAALALFLGALLIAASLFLLSGCKASSPAEASSAQQQSESASASQSKSKADSAKSDQGTSSAAPLDSTEAGLEVREDGTYTSKDEVALYIHLYGHLPDNFISKSKARKAGWKSSEGNLDEVCPGMSIGGSQFYNDEGALPDAKGRTWKECDIGYEGGYRGAERIVYSNDGLIFYTADHYKTFEQLY